MASVLFAVCQNILILALSRSLALSSYIQCLFARFACFIGTEASAVTRFVATFLCFAVFLVDSCKSSIASCAYKTTQFYIAKFVCRVHSLYKYTQRPHITPPLPRPDTTVPGYTAAEMTPNCVHLGAKNSLPLPLSLASLYV